MAAFRLFDAHAHLQNYKSDPGSREAFAKATASAALTLCAGTSPEDWGKVAELAGIRIFPCFGLHPWFVGKAGPGWEAELKERLLAMPSCVGEIGLDKASDTDPALQEEAFRTQLRLAKELSRPAVIHCVRAWNLLPEMLEQARPPAFMLHAYGGSAEMMPGLAALGGYFSFGGEVMDSRREKLRRALATAPAERLLFETEAPSRAGLSDVLAASARVRGTTAEELGELSWRNAKVFLGGSFPAETAFRGAYDAK